MNCPKCNAPVGENEKFCSNCGALIEAPAAAETEAAQPAPSAPAAPEQPVYQQPYQEPYYAPHPAQDYTDAYKPMSPWGYIGYSIIFAIPLIGFILLLVFSFDKTYINRRNYARAFLIIKIAAIILAVFGVITMIVLGFSLSDAVREFDFMM